MRTPLFARTTSRVLGNRQDSRLVAGMSSGHAVALAHSLPAWLANAGLAPWCVMVIQRAAEQASLRITGTFPRALRVAGSTGAVGRAKVRPAPRASADSV
jgi:hypothetical protein